MAFTVTTRGNAVNTYGTSVSTAAFTPNANSLLVAAAVCHTNTTTIDSISGHGSWTEIKSGTTSSGYVQKVFVLKIGGSPSNSAVTMNYTPVAAGGTGVVSVVEVLGADISGTAAAAVVQIEHHTGYLGSPPAAYSDSLAAFASATNLTLIFPYDRESGGITVESGYTEITNNRLHVAYKASEDTTPSVTFDGGSGLFHPGMFSMEIAEETGDATPPEFTAGPTVSASSSTGHTFTFTTNENCTVYAVRLADGATAPSNAQIAAGNDSADSAAPEAKSIVVTSGVEGEFTFSTGAISTAYDYYFTAKDAADNYKTVAKIDATTEAGTFAITGGVLQFGTQFNFTYTGITGVASPIVVGPDSQGNSLNVNITDNDDGTGFGTFPALPSSGSAARILIEDDLTVTVTEG